VINDLVPASPEKSACIQFYLRHISVSFAGPLSALSGKNSGPASAVNGSPLQIEKNYKKQPRRV